MNKITWVTSILLGFLVGIIFGVIGTLYYQASFGKENTIESSTSQHKPTLPIIGNYQVPNMEGFFMNDGHQLAKLSEFQDDSQIDFNSIISTEESSPTFSVQGSNFPLGSLRLKAYYAGIGVDLTYGETGATINSIFENSPAQMSGLQPGDVIIAVDGKPVKRSMSYTTGDNDLIGLMKQNVILEVLSGTSSRRIELPMSFRNIVSPNPYLMPEDRSFTVEPKDGYVLIHIDRDLEPGLYRFEFSENQNIVIGNYIGIGPTPLPTFTPVPLPLQKWIFMVKGKN
jgi:hypothetical protein